MKVVAKTISWTSTLFTVVVLLSAILLMGPKLLGLNPYIVESGSMEPLIPTGGIAYINEHETNVDIGDVVTYRIDGLTTEKLVTHRIVRKEDDKFITKGDANDVEDQNLVDKSQIIGKYTYSIPKLGFLFAKQDKLIPFIAAWVIGLNIISVMARGILEKSEKENKNA